MGHHFLKNVLKYLSFQDILQEIMPYTVADMSGHIMFPYVAYKEIFRKLNFSQCSVPHCGCKVAEKYRVVAAPTIYQVR